MNDTNSTDAASEIRLRIFGRTDVGQIREHNEDNFLIADLTKEYRGLKEDAREPTVGPRGNLFAVCDGMGGAAAGEVASQMAVDLIYETLASAPVPDDHDELAQNLVKSVEEAGLKIYNEARADRSRRGMGTTSTVAALIDSRLFLAQVGDSRAYLFRSGALVQVTRDQSLVNQLIEAGQLTEEEAETFEHNNIILQALGTAETVQVDLTYVDLRRGDTLLMCSDGLSGMVRDPVMKEVLEQFPEPVDACRELTERANAAGGHDNITVLLVQFGGEGLQLPEDGTAAKFQRYDLERPKQLAATSKNRPYRGAQPSSVSDEAARETRDLRVSHTMIGSMATDATMTPIPASRRNQAEDRYSVPTTGLPPALIGIILVLSMLLLLGVGVFFLR